MTSCSVWDYVVLKRLLYAKALLGNGETPAAACAKCGFRDYSPFFRAYKAQFGVSPKEHRSKKPRHYIDPPEKANPVLDHAITKTKQP